MSEIDLTSAGSTIITTETGDEAIFTYLTDEDAVVAGTGAYDPFLTTDGSGGGKTDGVTEGFNWDVANQATLDEVTGNSRTNSLDLSALKIVTQGEITYFEFRLDLNESPDLVLLNELKVYMSATAADPSDFNDATDSFGAGYTLILDLANAIKLIDHEPGSGYDDYKLLIPTSAFGDNPTGFVTFYANYGATPTEEPKDNGKGTETVISPVAEDGGFDEWSALTGTNPGGGGGGNPTASLTIEKVTADLGDDDLVDGTPGDGITVFAGENIRWQYAVTNTGEATFDSLSVTDDIEGAITTITKLVGDQDDLFEAGEKWVFTKEGVAASGVYTNSATATGHVAGSTPSTSVTSEADTSSYTGIVASLTLDKTTKDMESPAGTAGDGNSILVDEAIQWLYTVTNNGTVALHNIKVVDDNGTADLNDDVEVGTIATLEAGGSQTLTLNGVAKAGNYSNTATATAATVTDSAGHSVTASDSDESSYAGLYAHLTLDKTTQDLGTDGEQDDGAAGDGHRIFAGEAIQWVYTVQNDGNVDLENVQVVDDNGTESTDDDVVVGTIDLLAAGTSQTLYLAGEATAGSYSNTATATADAVTDSASHSVTATDFDASNYFGVTTGIDVEKYVSVDGGTTWLDADTIAGQPSLLTGYSPKFRFVVSNLSNVALENIVLSDDTLDLNAAASGTTYTIESLGADDNAAGGIDTFTLIVDGTWQRGQHTNTASVAASFTDSAGHTANVSDSDAANYFGADPAISIDKMTNGVQHGLNLFQGSAVNWTYAVTNTGNVALSNIVLKDDNGTVLNMADDFNPAAVLGSTTDAFASDALHNVGDLNNDGKLDVGESWQFKASGIAQLGSYSNIATVSGTFNDTANHTATATATDSSDYDGYSARARTQGFWNNVADSWDNVAGNESNSTKSKVASGELRGLDVNPRTDAYLLLGDTDGDGIADAGEKTVLISNSLAKAILASSTTGDARIIMLQQAIAAQLNVDNGTPLPNDLVGEAVMWLKGEGGWAGGAKITIDANGAIAATSKNVLLGTAVSTSSDAWKKFVDVSTAHAGTDANGEGLKNALMWYNQDQLVASGNSPSGHVAWYNGTTFVAEQDNTPDNFWLTLHSVGSLTGIA